MARRYHTLLVRDDANAPWTIHFGDYSKEVVWEEAEDLYSGDLGTRRKNMRVVTTGDGQAEISEAVRALNEKVPA